MRTIFVTGGAGFIGSEFIRQLTPHVRVINFDKLTYAGNLDNLASVASHPNYSFVRGDVCDSAEVAAAMPEACDIVHFAAELSRKFCRGRLLHHVTWLEDFGLTNRAFDFERCGRSEFVRAHIG